MARHRRRHDDDRDDMVEAAGPRPTIAAREHESALGEPAATVLDLQERAGNRAVAGLLAGAGPAVLREAIVPREPAKGGGADEEKDPAGSTLVIPDLDMTLAIHSASIPVHRRGPQGGPEDETRPRTTDIHVVVSVGPSTPVLQRAAAEGHLFGRMTLAVGSARFLLEDVVIASLTVGQEMVSMALSCGKVVALE